MDVLFNKTNWCRVGSSMWSMVVLLVSCLCGKAGVLFILGLIALTDGLCDKGVISFSF